MKIHVDQIGYLPNERKLAILSEPALSPSDGLNDLKITVRIYKENGDSTNVEPLISYHGYEDAAGDNTWIADFTGLTDPGTYYLMDDRGNKSYPFRISMDVYHEVFRDINRMFYYQRCGQELPETYAGIFKRPCCHTATVMDYEDHSHVFTLNGGWHDAGDFGRYASAGSVTVGHLLYAFSMFRRHYSMNLNIPESGNGIPDILNEVRYELDWLLQMQYENGSVAHKLTALYHAGYIMPEDDHSQFYRMPASSLATADFCAAAALASRIYADYDAGFAAVLKKAALRAWDWLTAHPTLVFENPADCGTGSYGDHSDEDERLWALAELARLTGDRHFHEELFRFSYSHVNRTRFGWADVSGFAGLCILFAPDGTFGEDITSCFRNSFEDRAYVLSHTTHTQGYRMSLRQREFYWGSNSSCMNNAIVLMVAAMISGNAEYASDACEQLHYLFGRNPLDVCYVSGHGSNPMKKPHNRISFGKRLPYTQPGFVSGGPNMLLNDECAKAKIPEGTAPMKCYVDEYESYSTNEIAIYWNSITVLVLAYFQ